MFSTGNKTIKAWERLGNPFSTVYMSFLIIEGFHVIKVFAELFSKSDTLEALSI